MSVASARKDGRAQPSSATVAHLAAAFAVVMLVSPSSASRAWGPTGHRVVARVAEGHLTDAARIAIENLLAPDTLVEASTWADEIRSDEAWAHASRWHYVNIADGVVLAPLILAREEGPLDIIGAIVHFESVLGNAETPAPDREIALRWLVHLIGDLHQPLHVGRAEDRGGNQLEAVWHGRSTNMHRIWDSDMIDGTRLSYSELAASIDSASEAEIDDWQRTRVLSWMNESRALRDRASTRPEPSRGGSYQYAYDNLGLVRQRLLNNFRGRK